MTFKHNSKWYCPAHWGKMKKRGMVCIIPNGYFDHFWLIFPISYALLLCNILAAAALNFHYLPPISAAFWIFRNISSIKIQQLITPGLQELLLSPPHMIGLSRIPTAIRRIIIVNNVRNLWFMNIISQVHLKKTKRSYNWNLHLYSL